MDNAELMRQIQAKYPGTPAPHTDPSSLDDDALIAALGSRYPKPTAPEVAEVPARADPVRSAVDWLQMAARTAVGAGTDIADLALMANPSNIARRFSEQVTEAVVPQETTMSDLIAPSQQKRPMFVQEPTVGEMATEGLDKIGFAKPETSTERYLDTIGRAVIGTKGLGVLGKGTMLAENMGRQLLSAAAGSGASEAAKQGEWGAGGQLAAGVAGALVPGGIANVVKNTIGGGSADLVYRLSEGGKRAQPLIDDGMRLAEQYGVDLTPAQISTGGAANAIENAARQSIFSRDAAFASDMKRADQYVSAINKTMEKISKGTSLATGETVRNNITRAVDDLDKSRNASAKIDFGEVDKLAGGAPIVPSNNVKRVLDELIDENSVGEASSGQAALSDVLQRVRNRRVEKTAPSSVVLPNGQPAIPAGEAVADMRASDLLKTRRYWSQIAGGQTTFSGALDRPIQQRAAARLLSALDDDIEAVGSQGGDLGDALTKANAKYREYSQRIKGVQKGPLSKLIGEDLTDASGNGFASVPEEKIMAGFSKLEPSQIKTVRGLIQKQDPEGWQAVKRAHIQSALEKAMETTGTEGAQQLPIRPARFFQALGAKTVDQNRLSAMMEPDELQQIDDLFKIGKRLGDRTGFNNSGTGPFQQLMGAISGLRSAGAAIAVGAGVGGVAGAITAPAAQAMTMRRVAAVMADPDARKAALDIARLPGTSPTALRAQKYLAGVMGSDNPAAMTAVAGGAVSQSGGESRDRPIAVRTPQEAKAYPRGTWVLLPDGTTEKVP